MADEVTKETDERLEEAAVRVNKVLGDMEDLTPVGDALLATKRGLGDASASMAELADQTSAAMEQWKAAMASATHALASAEAETKAVARAVQDVPAETKGVVEAATARLAETVGLLQAEFVEARRSAAEAEKRLREAVESSSRKTGEAVAQIAPAVEGTRNLLEEEVKRVKVLLRIGCGIGLVVAALVAVQFFVP